MIKRCNKLQKGFTLIEIMVALVLIGLLMGGATALYKLDFDKDKDAQAVESIAEIKSILETYLLVNKHLPCPDTFGSANGEESRSADGSCISRKGYLPVKTLDIKAEDPWKNPYFYQINPRAEQIARITDICESASVFGKTGALTLPTSFAQCSSTGQYFCSGCLTVSNCAGTCDFSNDPRPSAAPPYFGLSTKPFGAAGTNNSNLTITNKDGDILNETAVAVVLSFGRDGNKTWLNLLANSGSCTDVDDIDDEKNCDGDNYFIAPEFREVEDYIIWLDLFDIKYKALQKGLFE